MAVNEHEHSSVSVVTDALHFECWVLQFPVIVAVFVL